MARPTEDRADVAAHTGRLKPVGVVSAHDALDAHPWGVTVGAAIAQVGGRSLGVIGLVVISAHRRRPCFARKAGVVDVALIALVFAAVGAFGARLQAVRFGVVVTEDEALIALGAVDFDAACSAVPTWEVWPAEAALLAVVIALTCRAHIS